MRKILGNSTFLLAVMMLSMALFLPALQSGVGGGGQSNIGGGGGVSFPLLAPNGTFSAPSYAFSTSATTGLYLTAGPIINIEVNGTNTETCNTAPSCAFTSVFSSLYSTNSNCSSSASPAACISAAAGSVVVAAAATTVQVNTTAVTANSQILLIRDDSLGTKLGVTCNTATVMGEMKVSARVAATSFTITVQTAPATNPGCISYSIIN